MMKTVPGQFFLLLFLTLAIAFAFQGSRGLYETSEGRYGESAREMVETGKYLVPTLDYRPHWTKPPLAYWLMAAGMKLLGANDWGVRLFHAIAFCCSVFLVIAMGVTLWDRSTGLLAGLIYATSPFPVAGACTLTTDALLTLWELAAVLCYLLACRERPTGNGRGWMIAMWACWGLGFLTKGPPALLPLLPITIYHLRRKSGPRLADPWGLLLFFVLGSSWYVVVSLLHPGLLTYFLHDEVAGRVLSNEVHNAEWYQPFTLYLPVLLGAAGPWLYWGVKTCQQEGLLGYKKLWARLRDGSKGSFLLLWFLAPFIIFCLVKSRLPLYILPLYAPIALAIARGMARDLPDAPEAHSRRVVLVAVVMTIILVGGKAVTAYLPSPLNMRQLYEQYLLVTKDSKAEVFLYNDAKLHGLQFYLQGKGRRLSPTGQEPWAKARLSDTLAEIKAKPTLPGPVFYAGKGNVANLVQALRDADLRFERIDAPQGVWCVLPPQAGATILPESQ